MCTVEKLCEWHKMYSYCMSRTIICQFKNNANLALFVVPKTLLYLRINLALGEKDLTASSSEWFYCKYLKKIESKSFCHRYTSVLTQRPKKRIAAK
jgi:hypothetical protein